VFYGSNLYRKDNPRWVISNATETPKVPDAAFRLSAPLSGPWNHPTASLACGVATGVADRIRSACGIGIAWLVGLPRRAGTRLYAVNDAEARWSAWLVIERYDGLRRQYRDARFEALRHDPRLRSDELRGDLTSLDPAASPPPDCPCGGDL
jgi:hypothetical protein